jgi:hypothetical protein
MNTDSPARRSRNPIVLVVVLVLAIEAGEIEDEDENEDEEEIFYAGKQMFMDRSTDGYGLKTNTLTPARPHRMGEGVFSAVFINNQAPGFPGRSVAKKGSPIAVPSPVGRERVRVRAGLSVFIRGRLTALLSILPRIGQTCGQTETRDIHRPAGPGDQRRDARVRFLEIEKQQYAPGDRRVAVIEPVLAHQKQF